MMAPRKRARGRPKDPNSKRSLGLPRGDNKTKKTFQLGDPLFRAFRQYLEAFAEDRPKPSETSILQTALRNFLKAEGFWPPRPAKKAPAG